MSVTQADFRDRLSTRDPQLLRAVLEASEVSWSETDDTERLAKRLTDALWWRSHTPAGQVLMADSLDALVDRTARQLDVSLPSGDVWARLSALTAALLPPEGQPLVLEDIDPNIRARLRRPVWGRLAGATGAGGAFGARFLAARVLQWTVGPLWMVLARLPWVGPAVVAVRTGAGTVLGVAGPIGIGLALLTLNSALGPRYDRALPLLVGAGLVLRELPAEAE